MLDYKFLCIDSGLDDPVACGHKFRSKKCGS